jgi:hypothetical protein
MLIADGAGETRYAGADAGLHPGRLRALRGWCAARGGGAMPVATASALPRLLCSRVGLHHGDGSPRIRPTSEAAAHTTEKTARTRAATTVVTAQAGREGDDDGAGGPPQRCRVSGACSPPEGGAPSARHCNRWRWRCGQWWCQSWGAVHPAGRRGPGSPIGPVRVRASGPRPPR